MEKSPHHTQDGGTERKQEGKDRGLHVLEKKKGCVELQVRGNRQGRS